MSRNPALALLLALSCCLVAASCKAKEPPTNGVYNGSFVGQVKNVSTGTGTDLTGQTILVLKGSDAYTMDFFSCQFTGTRGRTEIAIPPQRCQFEYNGAAFFFSNMEGALEWEERHVTFKVSGSTGAPAMEAMTITFNGDLQH
jgi:hypothetical protein